MRIAISGAGVAGAALAHWLHRAGHTPTLIEQAPRFRTEFQRGAPLNYTALQNAFAGGPATSPMEPGQVASDRIRLLMGLWYHVSDGDGLHLNALQLRCAREASVTFGTQT